AGVCTPAKKGELRWNQFGGTLGGPVIKNKVFFFGDAQFWRLRQGQAEIGSVPTAAERISGFTDFSDLIQNGTSEGPDALGRSFPKGTIFDPATTRCVSNCSSSPVYARDPFPGNIIPVNRLDPNALSLLSLYPTPTNSGVVNNYANSPTLVQNEKQFDVRLDLNFTQKDQLYFSFSYDDKPELIPSIFGGIADGGGFFQGNQT